MKKAIFLSLVFLNCACALATVRTVSSNPATLGEFSTIQTAIDACSDGDTILVHGSPNVYPSFTLTDKFLTIIGPGWEPDKNLPLTAMVAGCFLLNTSAPGSPAGTELHGLIFTQAATLGYNPGTGLSFGNLRLIRCWFQNSVTFSLAASDVLFEGCLFTYQLSFNGTDTYQNFLFQNNIFFSNACCMSASIHSIVNAVNVRFDHNLFYQTATSNMAIFGSNCRFITLTNNIFNERDAAANLSLSTFTNNITFNAGNNDPWNMNGNVDGGGNISNQSPEMVDQAAVDAGSFSGLYNFTIPSGPANNAAADGKDIGLLFDATGSLNWTNSRNSRLPRIYSMNIINPTISEGGTLNVAVEARKSN